MQAAFRVTARVGPGHRLEIAVPELPEGEEVDVLIVPSRPVPDRTLPPSGLSEGDPEEQAERDREQAEMAANRDRWRAEQGRPRPALRVQYADTE